MKENKYFEPVSYLCEFSTYTTEDLETPDNLVDRWSPTGGSHRYQSVTDYMKEMLIPPFSLNPADWYYVGDGVIETSVLSSRICGSFAKDDFAKKPTKSDIAAWETGKKDLYIVVFRARIEEVIERPLSEESATLEGITV